MTEVYGMLRIKNEARWIEQVLSSIAPVCEKIFVFDDHSEDETAEICEAFPGVILIRSRFEGLDESRDREFLLQRIMMTLDRRHLRGDEDSPYWALAVDGDEVLEQDGPEILKETLANSSGVHAYKLPIRYLWDGYDQIRVDRLYGTFARPSLFRLMNEAFGFQRTPFNGNLHCASIPQELIHHAHVACPAQLWHLGYMHREDRLRKYEYYNSVDPGNEGEDCYRHMVIGDLPELPADSALKWAGPLELQSIEDIRGES